MEDTVEYQYLRIKAMEQEIEDLKKEILNLKLSKNDDN